MNFSDNLTLIGVVVTAIGSIAAVVGIVFVWLQVRAGQKVAKGEFLLHLNELFDKHKAAYRALIAGQWQPDQGGVSDLDMTEYISVFEQAKILIDYGIIDIDVFDALFNYRVIDIVMNDYLYQERLTKHGTWLPDFIVLCKVLAERWRSSPKTPDSEQHEFVARVDKLVVARPGQHTHRR